MEPQLLPINNELYDSLPYYSLPDDKGKLRYYLPFDSLLEVKPKWAKRFSQAVRVDIVYYVDHPELGRLLEANEAHILLFALDATNKLKDLANDTRWKILELAVKAVLES